MAGMLSKVRKIGGNILKVLGLVSVADTVTGATSKFSDWMTVAVIGLVAILILGRK